MALKTPYLMFLGDAPDQLAAKTAAGVVHGRADICIGQIRLPGCKADLGLPDMSIDEAIAAGAKTVIVGVANRGGLIPNSWAATLVEAIEKGFDIASGLHQRLGSVPAIAEAAAAHGRALVDARHPTRGMKATFRATGQTGIFIAGDGVSVDAVVADFISGATEWLSPDNESDHWDLVEGQGSLFHASYAGVSLGLLHGAQPDAIVLCHEPTRTHMRGLPGYLVPGLTECIDANLTAARLTNPAVTCICAAINTKDLPAGDVEGYLKTVEDEIGLPAVDPVATGVGRLVDNLPKPGA